MNTVLFDRLQSMPEYPSIIEEVKTHQSSEKAKAQLVYDSLPLLDRIRLSCKKSIEAIKTTFSSPIRFTSNTDYTYRKILAHLNNIPSSPEFPYEFCTTRIMKYYWDSILATLPPFLAEKVGNEELRELKEGFIKIDRLTYYHELACSIQTGAMAILSAGYKGHCIYLIFYKGYMVICNRGDRPVDRPQILAFKIELERLTPAQLKKIKDNASDTNREEGLNYLYKLLPDELEKSKDSICHELVFLSRKDQKVNNCTSTSYKEAFKAAYALLGIQYDEDKRAYIPEEHLEKANTVTELLSTHARATMLNYYCTPGLQIYYSTNSSGVTTEQDLPRDLFLIEQCRKKTWVHLQQAKIDPTNYPYLPKLTEIEEKQIRIELAEKQNTKESAPKLRSICYLSKELTQAIISEDTLRAALLKNPTADILEPAHVQEKNRV